MDLVTFERESAIHRKVYEGLREQIRREYAGQYVALAQGKLIAVAPTFDEPKAALLELAPVREYYAVCHAGVEPPFEPSQDAGMRLQL